MYDDRTYLDNNAVLYLRGREYHITGLEGAGTSSIVYHATVSVSDNSIKTEKKVLIKELYPMNLSIVRNKTTGALIIPKRSQNNFIKYIESFKKAVKLQIEFHNPLEEESDTLSATNSTSSIEDVCEHGNTLYSVMSIDNGQTYDKYDNDDLRSHIEICKNLAEAIWKYHKRGYLHLDIKPKNIFVLAGSNQIKLFDFDTVQLKGNINNRNCRVSFTEEFAPPELYLITRDRSYYSQIDQRSDIYLIGATLFYKLFDRTPSFSDRFPYKTWDFGKSTIARTASSQVKDQLTVILRKTLAQLREGRYNHISELINDFNDILISLNFIHQTIEKGIQKVNRIIKQTRGYTLELKSDINNSLSFVKSEKLSLKDLIDGGFITNVTTEVKNERNKYSASSTAHPEDLYDFSSRGYMNLKSFLKENSDYNERESYPIKFFQYPINNFPYKYYVTEIFKEAPLSHKNFILISKLAEQFIRFDYLKEFDIYLKKATEYIKNDGSDFKDDLTWYFKELCMRCCVFRIPYKAGSPGFLEKNREIRKDNIRYNKMAKQYAMLSLEYSDTIMDNSSKAELSKDFAAAFWYACDYDSAFYYSDQTLLFSKATNNIGKTADAVAQLAHYYYCYIDETNDIDERLRYQLASEELYLLAISLYHQTSEKDDEKIKNCQGLLDEVQSKNINYTYSALRMY